MESSCLLPRFPPTLAFLFFLLFSKATPGSSQQCLSQTFPKGRSFDHCEDLPQLGAFLHWSFRSASSSLDLAFVAPPATPFGWVAWAINPVGQGMIGAQALLAFRGADGGMTVETYNLTSYSSVEPSPISMEVSGLEADVSGGMMRIFATVGIPRGKTSVNHVWQAGGSMVGSKPAVHGTDFPNLNSKGRLDLQSNTMVRRLNLQSNTTVLAGASTADPLARKKKNHGILNGITWGILLPIGAMLARYLKIYKPENQAWYYAHISCQLFAYSIGTIGFFTGFQLRDPATAVNSGHRIVAYILFLLSSFQVAALLYTPQEGHRLRPQWNLLHKLIGATAVFLGVTNVLIGLSILKPGAVWMEGYISAVVVMGLLICFLESVINKTNSSDSNA
ncbi:cytochrome b561 and DOMON domain-containing protein At3g25290-like [Nymphaea colorata]|nr:cytochrome b561 and DOMON domain-containing protein At3g25290-like [Nymphaea colorata]